MKNIIIDLDVYFAHFIGEPFIPFYEILHTSV